MTFLQIYAIAAAAIFGLMAALRIASLILRNSSILVRISGVAPLEKSLTETRPGYREYTKTTSAFIPWFPRKKRKTVLDQDAKL